MKDNRLGIIGKAAQLKIPSGIEKSTWPTGGILSEDGKSPANCFVVKDGTRDEIENVLSGLKRFGTEEKKLVFIVAAGHGNLTAASQLFYTN